MRERNGTILTRCGLGSFLFVSWWLFTSTGAALFSVQSSSDTPSKAAGENLLKVCARPNAGFLELLDGSASGFEYELLSSFAEAEGLELELEWLDSFADMIPDVESGERCDVGSAAITVTEERAERVDFSSPYFSTRMVVVEAAGQTSRESADLVGKSIAVVGGTWQESLLADIDGVRIVALDTDEALFERLLAGDVDALACDSVVLLRFLGHAPNVRASFFLTEPADMGFAFPKTKGGLRNRLDRHLELLRDNGGFRARLIATFGEEAAAVVLGEKD